MTGAERTTGVRPTIAPRPEIVSGSAGAAGPSASATPPAGELAPTPAGRTSAPFAPATSLPVSRPRGLHPDDSREAPPSTASSVEAAPAEGRVAASARRGGLDVRAALSGTEAFPAAPAQAVSAVSVRRAVATTIAGAVVAGEPARRPGLDVQRALATPSARSPAQLAPTLVPAEDPAPPVLAVVPAPPSQPPPTPAATAPAVAPTVQRVLSEEPGAETAPRGRLPEAPDDELEELADRLYDHIRARFRAELLIDRERSGLLADRY